MDFLSASTLQLLIGAILALAVALIGWRLRWLDRSGAWAAFGLGVVVFGLGGFSWSMVLLTFFFTSSLLSKLFKPRKNRAEKFYAKGSQRDGGQVLANGGIAGVFVVLHVFFPDAWAPWVGFVAAFAAANADTWATELGVLARRSPVLISSREKVEIGTSGGITFMGTVAALAGSGLVSLVAWLLWPGDLPGVGFGWVIFLTLTGLAGSLVDSWLGATLQTIYLCPVCQKETEKHPFHDCGTETTYLRGLKWLDNDWVNLFCVSSAALLAIVIVWITMLF